MTFRPSLGRQLGAEFVGSLLLATIVVGSGIAAQQLSPNDIGLQLTENAAATALGLFVITLILGRYPRGRLAGIGTSGCL
jgi:glycerol uptake facilitator-like aquaporin